jgi:protoporphyrinogen oxidase
MEHVPFLIIGAGISGLSFANAIRGEAERRGKSAPQVLVLEADSEPGGYCKTVKQDGFVWDYSGHFFHFKHAEIESWLRARMPESDVRKIVKRSHIRFGGLDVDFPFQKNIHQLPRQDFIDCLHDLYFRDAKKAPENFKEMLYTRFGRSIAEKFLIPYNEKLYACDLAALDTDAMGRFFPHASMDDIVRNMKTPDNASYNSTFTYPRGGAIEYVHALLRDLPKDAIALGERVVRVDLREQTVETTKRKLKYGKLVSSAPLPKLLEACGLGYDAGAFSYNRVLVYNLGFDDKGPKDVHWSYFPDRSLSFYRVGFYDNIFDEKRMSLYVEIGLTRTEALDVEARRERVLADLAREKIIDGHRLLSWHSVTMDPAYVHITRKSLAETARARDVLAAGGVYSVGRYGGWTYCSIEDNIVETRALASTLGELV